MLDERRRQDKITRAAVEARQRILMAQIDGSRKR
jgi:hypothetical protein